MEAHRDRRFLGRVTRHLGASAGERDRGLVLALLAQGHAPMDVAVAALALARAGEPVPPIDPIGEVKQRPQRDARPGPKLSAPGPPRPRVDGREEGMVRLALDQGARQGVTPNKVVGAIARSADIPGRVLGRIVIEEQRTLVDVPEEFADRVLGHPGGYRLGKGVATASRA